MHSIMVQCLAMASIVMASIGSCGQTTPAKQRAGKATTTVYLVRHAEKEDDGDDPALSEDGQARANSLANRLKDAGIQRIFATDTRRTQQTVAPLARRLKLKVHVVAAEDTDAMARRVLDCPGENILVAAHSNTIGPIIQGLGGEEIDPMDESEFDNLYIVKIASAGDVIVKHERYGEPGGD